MKLKKESLCWSLLAASLAFLVACGQPSDDAGASAANSGEELSGSPDRAIQYVARSLGEGDGGILWAAMPAAYQSDVMEILQLAGSKIDADIYDKVFATLDRTISVADEQKEFLFNTQLGTRPPEEELEKFRAAWPSIVHLVKSLTESSLASASGLQSFDGEAFFSNTVSAVFKDLEAISKLNPDGEDMPLSSLQSAEVSLVSQTEEVATLLMNLPDGESEEAEFVRVGERWVPEEMASDWATNMAEARARLEAVDPSQMEQQKPQIMSVFAMIDGVLTQIEQAETQEQFDQALQGAMMPIMGILMMGQGMGGGAPAAPAMPTAP